MARSPFVSIIIPHYRGREILHRCLQALAQDEYQPREIILVDNASTDGSVDAGVEAFSGVKVIRSRRNLGFAAGCNLGMRFANGEYFVLLNDDAVVTPGWLAAMVDYMQKHEDVAAVQPKIKSLDEPDRFDYAGAAGGMIDMWGFPFARGRIFTTLERDEGQYDDHGEIFWASGTCTLLRRSAVEKVGDLDPRFFAHMEEIDLNWRFHLAGYRVVYLPDAVVFHNAGTTLAQQAPQKVFLNHRNNLLMLLKNYSGITLLWLFPVRLLFEWAAMGFALLQRDGRQALAIAKALGALPAYWSHIRRERARVKRLRKISDAAIRRKMYRQSIVLQYYLLKRKTYRELPIATDNT
ncbi:MAG: glycosyltransferase family 2 protein [Calditrichaeota bacterium]|nr:MAG: glycosyltransferase family 2 protein [Calditrichota bacterium]